jgi:hypothetical protein
MPNLDLYSVKDNQIHEELINKEYGQKEAWWDAYRTGRERKLALALGAVPPKPPIPVPDVPRMALGRAASRPTSATFGLTSSAREADLQSVSSELRDYMRDKGIFANRPFHKKGMPHYYGRSLHSSSRDGTDFSSRRG